MFRIAAHKMPTCHFMFKRNSMVTSKNIYFETRQSAGRGPLGSRPVALHQSTSVRTVLLVGLIFVSLFGFAGNPAYAQSGELQNLIESVRRLELQLSTLERNLNQPGSQRGAEALAPRTPVVPGNAAELLIRVTEIEQALRNVTGRLETLENELIQQRQSTDRTLSDITFRLQILESGGTSGLPGPVGPTLGSGATGPKSPTVTPPVIGNAPAGSDGPPEVASAGPRIELPAGDPQTQYNFAYNLVLNGRFAEAQSAFEAFIEANPEDALAGNSQYWVGETFYARGQFENAARAFARGFERYPASSKTTDNLLKLGMALARLDRDRNACDTFNLLLREYPQAPSSVRERALRERSLISC
jgi:tol-pal system protein YbgF